MGIVVGLSRQNRILSKKSTEVKVLQRPKISYITLCSNGLYNSMLI